jgi:hypothetical protein
LEDDKGKNKIDHPDKVSSVVFLPTGETQQVVLEGSKDCADAVAGSVMQALKNCLMPPDVDVMTTLLKKAFRPSLPQYTDNTEWVLDHSTQPKEVTKVNSSMDQKQVNLFSKILRKAKG